MKFVLLKISSYTVVGLEPDFLYGILRVSHNNNCEEEPFNRAISRDVNLISALLAKKIANRLIASMLVCILP